MTLIQLKQAISALHSEARALKTKAAQTKRYDKAHQLRLRFAERLNLLFTEGETFTLNREVLCTNTFGGGGYGITGEVKVLGVHMDSLVLASGDQCFTVDLLSQGWSNGALLALTDVLYTKGGDQRAEDLQSRINGLERSVKSGARLRNEIGKSLKGQRSQHHRDRVKREISLLRERRQELTTLSA